MITENKLASWMSASLAACHRSLSAHRKRAAIRARFRTPAGAALTPPMAESSPRVLHLSPASFDAHDEFFGGGKRYALEFARAIVATRPPRSSPSDRARQLKPPACSKP